MGATGSGKTTLVQLLPRLYDPRSGAVLIDGADVRDVDVVALRRAIAVVDDDPFLFSDTVAGNIAYARPDASLDEIQLAAERAQAAGFIDELPDGYDTRVGERGLTLSGGQRQRIAIARAFLADPRILILDDATSSVDATTEREIKAALREVMEGRTTFVIAHRLSTIALADDIVVLEKGRVDRPRHPRRAARRVRRSTPRSPPRACRTRSSSTATRSRRWRACERASRRPRPPLARDLRAAGASCAAWSCCCAPYRGRVALMFVSLVFATAAALAPPPLAKLAIDNGIVPGRHDRADVDRRRLPGLRARLLGRDLRADLPRRLDRPARAAGPADPALRAPAGRCRSASTRASGRAC